MDFYERLNSLIKSKGLSQHKLEIELGFSNGAISKWKKYQPQPDRLQKLAEYFGVTMEYLLTGKEKEDSPIYYTKEETAKLANQPKVRLWKHQAATRTSQTVLWQVSSLNGGVIIS